MYYKYCLKFVRGMRGVEDFIFYASNITLAKDHARMLCQDNMWELVKVTRYYGTEG